MKRPKGFREPTDTEMECLPEGALFFDDEKRKWVPSIYIGSEASDAAKYYAVPVTPKSKHTHTPHLKPCAGCITPQVCEVVGCDAPANGVVPNTPAAGTDPKQQHGEKKPQLHLVPKAALDEMARALELGARKYGERNWLLGDGVQLTTYLSAMMRHLTLLTDGKEDIDPESGAHHLGHVMAGCGIVLDAMKHGKLIDNRVKP